MRIQNYVKADSMKEALERYEKGCCILFAGGTDLMVKARGRNDYQNQTFLDIGGIEELKAIREEGKVISIGAAVTLTELLENRLVKDQLGLLCQAAGAVANVQVRNRATLVGNVANACPAADCVPALMVLGASILVASTKGIRQIPVEELFLECQACLRHEGMHIRTCFYSDPAKKKLHLNPGEIIKEILIPNPGEEFRWYFSKLTQNCSSDLAVVNLAMAGALNQEGRIRVIRTCMGGLYPKPMCMDAWSTLLQGELPSEAVFKKYAGQIGCTLEKEQKILADYAYKKKVVPELVTEGLRRLFSERQGYER